MGETETRHAAIAPPRHALLRPSADGFAAMVEEHHAASDGSVLAEWAAQARPLIARRRAPGDRPDRIPAGLPLPPTQGKRRIAVALIPSAIATIEPPPCLADIRGTAPLPWVATFDAVAALGRRVDSRPRVFGSFAWAALTGLPYLGPTSDLDLLWPLSPRTDIASLLEGLARIEADAPGRLDGELVQGAMAVNWRELHEGASEVLIKTIDTVMLKPARWFLRSAGQPM